MLSLNFLLHKHYSNIYCLIYEYHIQFETKKTMEKTKRSCKKRKKSDNILEMRITTKLKYTNQLDILAWKTASME